MLDSFILAGFDPNFCEYLRIDNILSNTYEAFGGLNRFLREAKGEYVILCHQDILLHDHQIDELELIIKEMNLIDPRWAILGNAGGINLKYRGMNLTQAPGKKFSEENLPLKVVSVDENFILVKNEANLALSHDLEGFHMYGADLCLIAEVLGFSAYIVNFNLIHKSGGNADQNFDKARVDLMKKYRRAFRGRFISTTITRLYLSGNRFAFHLFNSNPSMFIARQFYKFFRPKSRYGPGK